MSILRAKKLKFREIKQDLKIGIKKMDRNTS